MKLPTIKPTIVHKELPEGALILSTEDEVYFGLNSVGNRVWRLLPPECSTLDELVERLATEFTDVSRDVIRNDVVELLRQLVEKGLVEDPASDGPVAGG